MSHVVGINSGSRQDLRDRPPGARTIVIRFPSYEAAHAWYHSNDYAEAKHLRMAASASVETIVEGI